MNHRQLIAFFAFVQCVDRSEESIDADRGRVPLVKIESNNDFYSPECPMNKKISRQEFIKSSAGAVGAGLLAGAPFFSEGSQNASDIISSNYRKLGRTGIGVSALGFGATVTMEPSLIKRAVDAGITFFDTGRMYQNGQNEIMLGKVFKGIREKVVIQSKLSVDEKIAEYDADKLKKSVRSMQMSLDQSLKALQTDYIDILLGHRILAIEQIFNETVMEFFENAKKSGKVRAVGFSSHSVPVEAVRENNKNRFFDVLMIPYNFKGSYTHTRNYRYNEWDQAALEKELENAEENEIGIVAMKTCSTGPFAPDEKTEATMLAGLKWVLRHSFIRTMAVAMTNNEELDENLKTMV